MKKKEIKDARVCDAIAKAAYNGSVEFVTEIARANPELVWTRDVAIKVFKNAIKGREPKVFSLIHGLHDKEALANSVESRTTILHAAAELASQDVRNLIPGEALQMQRDLQWFKEVETLVPYVAEYEDRGKRNPRDLFTEEHKDLLNYGEKWMKETANSCTIVGTLIVTIMFTVAFTVPGGNDQNTGFPLLSNKILFKIFMISDAISLFSSTTSVLMFLGILTSRYAEVDFLKSLPNKLVVGLSTLFLSIATMMIAFSAALSIMFHGQLWMVVPVILLACVPVTLFMWMQFPPLFQMIMSTYGPSIFDRKVKNWLYVTND
ncbi:PGG domain containing protein [Trema orientale]|uniref:PGG domain containing protein n=1 Tax=Trema orientale TaxID=63057 RepID=A0A2P5EQZ0_TREOI|nr:PGG domain containing protein [Trema orientale]